MRSQNYFSEISRFFIPRKRDIFFNFADSNVIIVDLVVQSFEIFNSRAHLMHPDDRSREKRF